MTADQPPSGPGVSVRAAGPCEVALLAELNRLSFAAPGAGAFAGTPWSARSLAEVMALPGVFGMLALAGEAPAGFLLAQVLFEDAEILSLGVLPEHRRAGHGRRLLQAAMAEAARRGARRLRLEVAENNRGALGLYTGLGFAPAGRRRNYYRMADGTVVDAVICDCKLAPPGGAVAEDAS
ncbi:MAG: GNAT family N-acetyltransferase [Kiloniellaceae bacterium]